MSPPESGATFPDGAHYRIELATVNTIQAFQAAVRRAKKLGLVINRVVETWGIFRHTKEELRAYVDLGREEGIEVVMSIGPRATYDTSATRLSTHGSYIGYRLRGTEQLIRAVEDVRRAQEAGCTNVVVYDEGLLWILDRMRRDGFVSPALKLKASAHMGHCNPASIRMLEALGANSINPVRDLPLDVIAGLRKAAHVPLDLHTDSPRSSGEFVRNYEAPMMVRVAAPVHLKTGTSEILAHGQKTGADDGERLADQASIVQEMVARFYPEAVQSKTGSFRSDPAPQPRTGFPL